ncbi:acyltransferase family protein [Altererythrobacter indicus]|uniref:Acyltransferase family protein n=1 Tax=Altericroceibacterium indicum TaxID=374177 RepID=A0A845ADG7_9SPHN|nr:acyltransferase [Altericroceibacterium indicum]MXP27021.1 acyltransferase family protein [Altericroceibacterium indicum]
MPDMPAPYSSRMEQVGLMTIESQKVPQGESDQGSKGRNRTINSIQILRAYAAITVLIGHSFLEVLHTNGLKPSFNVFPLVAGVDIFFVISGFIMFYTSADLFQKKGGSWLFLKRRFIRVVPLYWFFTTLMLLALVALGQFVRSTQLDIGNVISSYLFLPYAREGGRIAPILSLGWTLNYEMFFYVIFSVFIIFKRQFALAGLLITLLLLSVIGVILQPSLAIFKFWTDSVILEFGIGCILGYFYSTIYEKKSLNLAIFFAIAGLCLLILMRNIDLPRLFIGGIPACLLVLGGLLLPEKNDKKFPAFLLLLGNASYSLYLCHRFVLRILTIAMSKLSIPANAAVPLYVVLALIISIPVAVLVYRYIETPMVNVMRKKRKSPYSKAEAA